MLVAAVVVAPHLVYQEVLVGLVAAAMAAGSPFQEVRELQIPEVEVAAADLCPVVPVVLVSSSSPILHNKYLKNHNVYRKQSNLRRHHK
jgi:hypothetical protein